MFFIKLFGTVVETSSGRHIHLSLRENQRFSWQSKNTCVAVDYFVTAFLVMTKPILKRFQHDAYTCHCEKIEDFRGNPKIRV